METGATPVLHAVEPSPLRNFTATLLAAEGNPCQSLLLPMNQMNATATPMFNCFTNTPDFTPFTAVTNQVPLDQMNPDSRQISDSRLRKEAFISARLPLKQEDQCPEDLFNHILWRATEGSQTPYPAWAVKLVDDDD